MSYSLVTCDSESRQQVPRLTLVSLTQRTHLRARTNFNLHNDNRWCSGCLVRSSLSADQLLPAAAGWLGLGG